MKLSSLLQADHIVLGLESRTLRESVAEIMDRADHFWPAIPVETITEAVLRREEQGSTASERGLALPHARIPGLRDFYMMLGLARKPLDDKGFDDQQVDLVFLIVSSDEKSILMLQTLAAIATLSENEDLLKKIRSARSREAVWDLVNKSRVQIRERLCARDIMRHTPVIARKDMLLRELIDLFFEHRVYEAPVCTEAGELIGAVSATEIIDAGFPDYMSRIRHVGFLSEFEPFQKFFNQEATTTVSEILNPKPLVVDVEDPLIQVVCLMRRSKQQLAFVQDKGRFVGVIDRNDIISRILRM